MIKDYFRLNVWGSVGMFSFGGHFEFAVSWREFWDQAILGARDSWIFPKIFGSFSVWQASISSKDFEASQTLHKLSAKFKMAAKRKTTPP